MENTILLNNGVEMPRIGYGVYQIPAVMTERCVRDALSAGYRSIDTAQCYGNEAATGKAIRASGIPRDELFVTTKLWGGRGYKDTVKSIDSSLKALDVGAVNATFNISRMTSSPIRFGRYRRMERRRLHSS